MIFGSSIKWSMAEKNSNSICVFIFLYLNFTSNAINSSIHIIQFKFKNLNYDRRPRVSTNFFQIS